MTDTPLFALTQMVSGQDGVELYNEHLRILEAMSLRVFDDRLTTPPGTVAPGEVYLIDGTGAGAWASHDNELAIVIDGIVGSTATYHFVTRAKGMVWFVEDDDALIYCDGTTTWVDLHTGL